MAFREQRRGPAWAIQTYGPFLASLKWTLFVTLTFKNRWTPGAIRRAMPRFFGWTGFSAVFWVCERGDLGRLHVHALVKFSISDRQSLAWSKRRIQKKWSGRYGRASVEVFDPAKAGAQYVEKCLGDPECDWDIYIGD